MQRKSELDSALKTNLSDANEHSSYIISLRSRITGTGPISSTVSAMDLDLTFNGFCFGRIKLPEVKTSFWGTDVVVKNQKIRITDMAIYKAFVRSMIVDDETSFQLENGACTIKALGITANCNYSLKIGVQAIGGPRVTLTNLQRVEKGITATFRVKNPSPVEIDHGNCTFHVRNQKGQILAELKGHLKIVQGEFDYVVIGTPRIGVDPTEKVRVIGVGTEGTSWCNETIRYIDTVVDLPPKFADTLR